MHPHVNKLQRKPRDPALVIPPPPQSLIEHSAPLAYISIMVCSPALGSRCIIVADPSAYRILALSPSIPPFSTFVLPYPSFSVCTSHLLTASPLYFPHRLHQD